MAMPSSRVRVVCGLGVTMASLRPTRRLSSVDLPAFGAPISATYPHRVGAAVGSFATSGGVVFRPVDDLGMSCEPDALAGLGVAYDLREDPDPRTIADHVRVHRELEDAPLVVGGVEFAPEYVQHIGR